jgi:hypothetical protein
MFSFLKNLKAIFQIDVLRFILTSSVPMLHTCYICALSKIYYPSNFLEAWGWGGQNQGWNSGLHSYKAGTLPLEPHFQIMLM